MSAVPTKIVLKSTTRMSLNDRFSTITPSIQNIRANVQAEHQVSAANRRLAQQLANRPGVQMSGPGLYQQGPRGARRGNFQQQNMQQNMQQSNRNLQQRLGQPNSAGNVKNRLTLPARGRGGRGRGNAFQAGGDNQMNQQQQQQRGRGGYNFRGQQTRGAGRGRGGIQRGRGGANTRVMTQNNSYTRGAARGGTQGRGRGMQRGGRGGRGRGRGGNFNTQVSQGDLDNQLDEYMAKTKSSLDSELDTYMSEANV